LHSILDGNLQISLTEQVQTSAMSYIKPPMIQKYKLIIPPNIEEQQKIATCLSSLDDLITLQTQKKGLMQGLFPAADEVLA
jgi:type I restriction enzyme, S subunit